MSLEAQEIVGNIIYEPNISDSNDKVLLENIQSISDYAQEIIDETLNRYPIIETIAINGLKSCKTEFNTLLTSLIELTEMGVIAYNLCENEKSVDINNLLPWTGVKICIEDHPHLLQDLKILRDLDNETLFSTLFYAFTQKLSSKKQAQSSFLNNLPEHHLEASNNEYSRDFNTPKVKDICNLICEYVDCIT